MIDLLLFSIIIPLLLTIVIETITACLFFRSRDDLIIVVLAQCITNPVLNLILILCRFWGVEFLPLVLVVLEIIVIVVEALVYYYNFSQKNRKKSLPLSIVANVAAWATGYIIYSY